MKKENMQGKVLETTVTVSSILLSVLASVPLQILMMERNGRVIMMLIMID